jgi:excinuclease ABC subunit A
VTDNLPFPGDGDAYEGIHGWFAWLETRTYRMHIRIFLARFRSYVPCTGCHGGRLKAEALLTRIRGKDITQISAMSVGDTSTFFRDLTEAYHHDPVISLLLGEIVSRLQYLSEQTPSITHADR